MLAGMQDAPWSQTGNSPSMLSRLGPSTGAVENLPTDIPVSGQTGLEPSATEVQEGITQMHHAQQVQRVCARTYDMLHAPSKLAYEHDMLHVYVKANEGRAQITGRERITDAGQNPPRTLLHVEWVEYENPVVELSGNAVDTRAMYDTAKIYPTRLYANTYKLGSRNDRRQYELDLERLYYMMPTKLVRILEKDRMIDITLEIPYTVAFMEWIEFEQRKQADPDNDNQ